MIPGLISWLESLIPDETWGFKSWESFNISIRWNQAMWKVNFHQFNSEAGYLEGFWIQQVVDRGGLSVFLYLFIMVSLLLSVVCLSTLQFSGAHSALLNFLVLILALYFLIFQHCLFLLTTMSLYDVALPWSALYFFVFRHHFDIFYRGKFVTSRLELANGLNESLICVMLLFSPQTFSPRFFSRAPFTFSCWLHTLSLYASCHLF